MRRTKTGTHKRKQLANQTQEGATTIERIYQDAATTGLKATSRSVGEFNDGFQQIADEMNGYAVRSLERVFYTWQQFLNEGPYRQVIELQRRYAQNAQTAYDAYVDEISRLGDLYLDVTRRASKPLGKAPRRSK